MPDNVEQITSTVSIVNYISQYVQLKPKGKNLYGLCPFHKEKTPSFCVSYEKRIFKCFGCGKGGDVIKFVQLYQNTDFKTALKTLAEYQNIILSPYKKYNHKENKLVPNLYDDRYP